MPTPLLDNVCWHSLNGPHRAHSAGTPQARRYARGFSPVMGFPDNERADFAGLQPFCDIGEHLYCGGWTGAVPTGWQLDADSVAHQMVWAGPLPQADDTLGAVRLTAAHLPQVLELIELTQPGPFAQRTIELGEYVGVFENGRLVAMAGERFEVGSLREISAVCTHPDHRGHGLARRLMERLIRMQIGRGQTPFLHVMHDNPNARRLYARMGFRHEQDMVVRVVSRVG